MSIADRFNWAGPGIEITKPAPTEDETKAGIKHVRDPAYWGAPYGTPITPGMREAHKKGGARAVKKLLRNESPSVGRSKRRTGGTGKRTAATPKTVSTGNSDPAVYDRATGLLRAWGSRENAPDIVRKNVKSSFEVEYVSKAELDRARKLAIKRAKNSYQPTRDDIRFTKYINENGGPGSSSALREKNMDKLRGNFVARSQRSWAVYIAFGGIDSKGNDKGYVPCLGCGVKMTWHNDRSFTNYPKFEHDKVIITGDGGLYHSGNIVPMCAGCNNQRGNKKLWESSAFKGSKPSWYTAEFEALVKRTKGDGSIQQNRPPNEDVWWIMPVPPGKARGYVAKSMQTKNETIERAERMWMTTDPTVETDSASNGDRVSAHLWNFDGRHDDIEAGVFPPDVDDPQRTVVGKLVIESVDSAFGEYDRYLVIEDDGFVSFVEQDTIVRVASAPDYNDSEAFDETTNGTGGGGGGRGRLDARASRRSRRVHFGRTQRKAAGLLAQLEEKGRIRRVRTAAGVAKYGLPLGSIIVADVVPDVDLRRGAGRTSSHPLRYAADLAPLRKAEPGKYEKLTGETRDRLIAEYHNSSGNFRPGLFKNIPNTDMFYSITESSGGRYLVEIRDDKPIVADSIDEAVDVAISQVVRRHERLTKKSTKPDPDGKLHTNRTKRPLGETMIGWWQGVRGVDWQADDDDLTDSEEARAALVDKEAAELGYKWGSASGYTQRPDEEVGLWAKELMNGVMRAHADMYPGFTELFTNIVGTSEVRQAVAFNGRSVGFRGGKRYQSSTLGMNPKYFSDWADEKDIRRMWESGDRSKSLVNHSSVDMNQMTEESGWSEEHALLIYVMTHELGHTVGNILQNRLWQNGYSDDMSDFSRQTEAEGVNKTATKYRNQLIDLFEDYGFIDAQSADSLRGNYDYGSGQMSTPYLPAHFDRGQIAEHLSTYGSTNFSEIMAETWAAYQLDTNPTDFVMDLGALMDLALQDFLADETGERAQYKSLDTVISKELS